MTDCLCLCSDFENTRQGKRERISLSKLIKDVSAPTFWVVDVIWGWALIHFGAKAAKLRQILCLSQARGCCAEEVETHRHNLLFWQLCSESDEFHLRSAKNTLEEVQIILKCPLVMVGSCEMEVRLSPHLSNKQGETFFIILRYTLQGML